MDAFSDTITSAYGEALRDQVEERLKFFESGETPRKNADVMTGVTTKLRASGVLPSGDAAAASKKDKKDKKEKKSKKDKKRALEEEEEPVVRLCCVCVDGGGVAWRCKA